MRFEDRTDEETVIKVMTDGILLQELKSDRLLSRYSVLMVDEAHERSLNIDFILGMLKGIMRGASRVPRHRLLGDDQRRGVFRVLRRLPDREHRRPDVPGGSASTRRPRSRATTRASCSASATSFRAIMQKKQPGDILIFLPGELAIKDCMQMLADVDRDQELALLPLYGRLSHEDQGKVFLDFPGKRKVIVATNIAETSITIDGVVSVIDSGLGKVNFYSPKTFTESLIEVPVSRASCNQRRGRAGRTAPGVCYRLYTKKDLDGQAHVHDGGDPAHGSLRSRPPHGGAGHQGFRILRFSLPARAGRNQGGGGDPPPAGRAGRGARADGNGPDDVHTSRSCRSTRG